MRAGPPQTRPRTPRCGHRDGGVHGSFAVAGRAEPAPPIAPATGPSAVQVLSAPSISVLPPEALRAVRARPATSGPAATRTEEDATGAGRFSRLSSSALTATISDDPDIDRAAISGRR